LVKENEHPRKKKGGKNQNRADAKTRSTAYKGGKNRLSKRPWWGSESSQREGGRRNGRSAGGALKSSATPYQKRYTTTMERKRVISASSGGRGKDEEEKSTEKNPIRAGIMNRRKKGTERLAKRKVSLISWGGLSLEERRVELKGLGPALRQDFDVGKKGCQGRGGERMGIQA